MHSRDFYDDASVLSLAGSFATSWTHSGSELLSYPSPSPNEYLGERNESDEQQKNNKFVVYGSSETNIIPKNERQKLLF